MAKDNSKMGILDWLTVLLQTMFIGFDVVGLVSWPWWKVALPSLVYLGIALIGLLIVTIKEI